MQRRVLWVGLSGVCERGGGATECCFVLCGPNHWDQVILRYLYSLSLKGLELQWENDIGKCGNPMFEIQVHLLMLLGPNMEAKSKF